MIRQTGLREYEIKSAEGVIWRYKNGTLLQIVVFKFGTIMVECQGSNISVLRLTGEELPEVEVKYNDHGKPLKIYNFGQAVAEFSWESRQLKNWTDVDKNLMEFTYDQNNLLSGISYPEIGTVKVGWAENSNWQRGDSKWPLPLHLSQFGSERYEAHLNQSGLVIKIIDTNNAKLRNEFSFNPLTKKATARISSEFRHVLYEQ